MTDVLLFLKRGNHCFSSCLVCSGTQKDCPAGHMTNTSCTWVNSGPDSFLSGHRYIMSVDVNNTKRGVLKRSRTFTVPTRSIGIATFYLARFALQKGPTRSIGIATFCLTQFALKKDSTHSIGIFTFSRPQFGLKRLRSGIFMYTYVYIFMKLSLVVLSENETVFCRCMCVYACVCMCVCVCVCACARAPTQRDRHEQRASCTVR